MGLREDLLIHRGMHRTSGGGFRFFEVRMAGMV
jgi:hypothetical protein